MQKKTDRRVRKTKSQLKTGLAQLMREKSIREITVKELVDAVDINRSTFYLHYSDIPGLLAEVENETLIGYKYFKFSGNKNISVTIRKETENNKVKLEAPKRIDERCDAEVKRCASFKDNAKIAEESYIDEGKGKSIGRISIPDNLEDKWCRIGGNVNFPDGVYPLYFVYHGKNSIQIKSFDFIGG